MKGLWWCILIAITLVAGRSAARAQGIDLQLRRGAGEVTAWVESTGRTNRVHVLESSRDLQTWQEWAVMHDGPFAFPDLSAFGETRFYRARSRAKLSSDDGKSVVTIPDDPFANEDANYYDPIRPCGGSSFSSAWRNRIGCIFRIVASTCFITILRACACRRLRG